MVDWDHVLNCFDNEITGRRNTPTRFTPSGDLFFLTLLAWMVMTSTARTASRLTILNHEKINIFLSLLLCFVNFALQSLSLKTTLFCSVSHQIGVGNLVIPELSWMIYHKYKLDFKLLKKVPVWFKKKRAYFPATTVFQEIQISVYRQTAVRCLYV